MSTKTTEIRSESELLSTLYKDSIEGTSDQSS